MKQTDFERLKRICKNEGFIVFGNLHKDDKLFIIEKKDIWEGVEFGESMESGKIITANKIYKFISSGRDHVTIIDDLNDRTSTKITYFKPSTESAYVEQLKAEAFKRLGDIKDGDSFINPHGAKVEVDINFWGEFNYDKEQDILDFGGCFLYEKGKWATKIPKRIEVTVSGYGLADYKTHKCFEVEFFIHDSEEFDQRSAAAFLGRKLEEELEYKK